MALLKHKLLRINTKHSNVLGQARPHPPDFNAYMFHIMLILLIKNPYKRASLLTQQLPSPFTAVSCVRCIPPSSTELMLLYFLRVGRACAHVRAHARMPRVQTMTLIPLKLELQAAVS